MNREVNKASAWQKILVVDDLPTQVHSLTKILQKYGHEVLEKTLRCLESLSAVKSPSFKILLWDNGSHDATAEAVQEVFPEVLVHHNSRNIGVASGRNEAAKIMSENFGPRYFLFLDNDMTVEPHFLEALIAPFEHSSSLAQTTAKICDLNDPHRLYGAGGCQAQFWRGDTMHVGYGEHDDGQYDNPRKCYPSGGCMLVRADVFEKLGDLAMMSCRCVAWKRIDLSFI